SVRRSGALVDGRVLEKALAVLEEDGSLADLAALLDRRRIVTLVQADIDRREEEMRQRWRKARPEAQALIGVEAAQAADAGLAGEDLLPVAEALDEIEARAARAAAPDPLSKARADLEAALEACQDFLAPRERDWVSRGLSNCPAGGDADVPGATLASWSEALAEIGKNLQNRAAWRRQAIARLEERLGDSASLSSSTGQARLCLLVEALGQRRSAAEGRLEAALGRLLDAEW